MIQDSEATAHWSYSPIAEPITDRELKLNKILDLIFEVAPEFVLLSLLLLNLSLITVVLIIATAYLAICYLIGGVIGVLFGAFAVIYLSGRGNTTDSL